MNARCDLHGSPAPCGFCRWAASGSPGQAGLARARADRVANRIPHGGGSAPRVKPPAPHIEPPLPSLARQAASFLTALARFLAAGMPRAEAERKAERMAVCQSNACGLYRVSDGRCGSCGCKMRRKAAWENTACPKGLWPTDPEPKPPGV